MVRRFDLSPKLILLIVILSITVSNCTTTTHTYTMGNEFTADNLDKIITGKTTRDDIIRLFGEPLKIGSRNGKVIYTYSYQEIKFTAFIWVTKPELVEKTGDTLVIEFDENNKVEKYYLNVPGVEPIIIGLLLHKEEQRQEEEQSWATWFAFFPGFHHGQISGPFFD